MLKQYALKISNATIVRAPGESIKSQVVMVAGTVLELAAARAV